MQAFEEDAAAGLSQQMRALSALHTVRGAFEDAVSTWAVVKGPVLSAHVYGRPDLRTYEDPGSDSCGLRTSSRPSADWIGSTHRAV